MKTINKLVSILISILTISIIATIRPVDIESVTYSVERHYE